MSESGLLEHIIVELRMHNQLLEKRNEMLRESVDQQKRSILSAEEHQRASLQALESPRQLEEMAQQFAQALELWSCDVGNRNIPRRFQRLKELLPGPVWEHKVTDSEMVIEEVLAERVRQVEQEGWSTERDDKLHADGQLAFAAACYAVEIDLFTKGGLPIWPWSKKWDKRGKHGYRRSLIIAAALIVAEIERLDRKNGASK